MAGDREVERVGRGRGRAGRLTVEPFTFQSYWSATGSPSASAAVTVAVRVSFERGPALSNATATVGALFATVADAAAGAPSPVPSFGVTVTVTVWPRSPWPAGPRSNVSVVAVVVVVRRVVPSTVQM